MSALPLADAPTFARLARRTRLALGALALGLLALVALTAVSGRRPATHVLRFLPAGSNGIVVLDVSASISTDTYSRIGATLSDLAGSGGRFGLVVFSDVAYEALPPRTPAARLRPLVRYFTLPKTAPGFLPSFPVNPWTSSFSAGTKISRGLELALSTVRRQHLRHTTVILVSDLDDDPGDVTRLTSLVLAYRRSGVPLHVVALNATPEAVGLVKPLLSGSSALTYAHLPGERAVVSGTGFPVWLAVCGGLLALLLAANELFGARLSWGRA